ncbi:SH3 domain-containing protein [Paraburkholderia sp. CNPSo 3272]|uniref:SH3 domain-containing C40 family peptidase n=1 Tax=Paraburkholderia sp. CNPSo 3272 TaxID=2940931 RepID=UPI0020B89ABA|nr:SH3 domain-containing C40 family peptidase [Paraburkholderia sp. CNPSo 3272]MCP3725638.1 SH3 domain-containing protein [Paraburkholderia sp. CNPSo 3272]
MRSALDSSFRLSAFVRAPRARFLALTLAAACVLPGCATGPASQNQAGQALPPDTVTLFPIAHYEQNVDHWIDPASADYDKPFLSPDVQRAQFDALVTRYFGAGPNDPSPWNRAFVEQRVYRDGGSDIAALQTRRLAEFDNTGKAPGRIGYGMNFRPHTKAWIDAIERNANVNQFEQSGGFDATRRAIATTALYVRELPTIDPSFYSHRIAGEGYPFDNLQVSAVRPGTPLYVLGTSGDGAWRYVQTPDVQGWVRSDGVASVDETFVSTWRAAAHHSLGVVVVACAALRDDGGVFRFDAPAGTLLPVRPASGAKPGVVLVPARDVDGRAAIRTAALDTNAIVPAPLAATPRHLAQLMKALIGRPYGWGNTNFDNDCSAELQSIFAAFGVWLPRHSSTQMNAGAMTDLSASTPGQRLDWLVQHGAPMRTLIYIGGHVMLYLGNTERDGKTVPLVYQDVWGLRPADNSRRAVIGGSVVLPLLLAYPEDPGLESLAGTPVFQVSILGAPAGSAPPAQDEENPAG